MLSVTTLASFGAESKEDAIATNILPLSDQNAPLTRAVQRREP
jgi:hypothetical protein